MSIESKLVEMKEKVEEVRRRIGGAWHLQQEFVSRQNLLGCPV